MRIRKSWEAGMTSQFKLFWEKLRFSIERIPNGLRCSRKLLWLSKENCLFPVKLILFKINIFFLSKNVYNIQPTYRAFKNPPMISWLNFKNLTLLFVGFSDEKWNVELITTNGIHCTIKPIILCISNSRCFTERFKVNCKMT